MRGVGPRREQYDRHRDRLSAHITPLFLDGGYRPRIAERLVDALTRFFATHEQLGTESRAFPSLDARRNQTTGTFTATRAMTAGEYEVRVERY